LDYLTYILLGIIFILLFKRMMPVKGVKQISTIELKAALKDKNKQYIDVRTPGEFKRDHIKGFKNLPLQQIMQKAEKELSKEKEVIVICQSGMRSKNAIKVLQKIGFTKLTNVKGGMNAWKS